VLLNGGKEIAKHVQRGVRTVQRWERDFGLPVRRLGDGARAPVIADSEEVDQWLLHWGKRASEPKDAISLVEIAEARRSALHKKVEELVRRRAEILEASTHLRKRLKPGEL